MGSRATKVFPESIARVNRATFLNRKPGRIAIAVPLEAGYVVTFVLGVSEGLGFNRSQLGIVTSCFAVLTGRKIALVLCVGCLFRLQRSELRMVAFVPAILTILSVALMLRRGRVPALRRS